MVMIVGNDSPISFLLAIATGSWVSNVIIIHDAAQDLKLRLIDFINHHTKHT
uniref:Uncharacterized protein n=1 Tax=Musa acuminata subsp. malaccensis TaxID=214687 RepID=A0A804JYJ3_MUSAM